MMLDTIALYTLFTTGTVRAEKNEVPEPEFKPFRFAEADGAAARARALAAANTAREPRTLEELGVPGALARELEGALRRMGRTAGDRITGFTFRTDDGTRYALRAGTPVAAGKAEKAA